MQQEAVRLPASRAPLVLNGDLFNRFNERLDTSGECWLWTGCVRSKTTGYGAIKCQGRVFDTHVLAWRIAHGGAAVPARMHVRHSCHNRLCCNPNHLSIGTPKDNHDDMVKAGRRGVSHGESRPNAILDECKVREIRVLHANGIGVCEIARYMRIEKSVVSKVVRRVNWRHVQ